jgi:hypothetical protein
VVKTTFARLAATGELVREVGLRWELGEQLPLRRGVVAFSQCVTGGCTTDIPAASVANEYQRPPFP